MVDISAQTKHDYNHQMGAALVGLCLLLMLAWVVVRAGEHWGRGVTMSFPVLPGGTLRVNVSPVILWATACGCCDPTCSPQVSLAPSGRFIGIWWVRATGSGRLLTAFTLPSWPLTALMSAALMGLFGMKVLTARRARAAQAPGASKWRVEPKNGYE